MLASACGGGGGGGTPDYGTMGMLGSPSLALILSNIVLVDASINGSGGNVVLIDSGSPVVLVDGDPGVFPGLTLPDSQLVNVDFSLLDQSAAAVVTIDQIPAFQLTSAMMDTLGGFAGILGGNIMRQFSVQLDYAAPLMAGFCLGCTSAPRDDVESPGAQIAFSIQGGGTTKVELGATTDSTTVTLPATRIPLTVTLDGTAHAFMLDTGASEVSIRGSVYQDLVSDNRAQLAGGFEVTTVDGPSTAQITRARTLSIGGETVLDPPVMTIPGDSLLDSLSSELGYTLDGLLGGSFLRNFLVTIDYPKGQLHLQRYTSPPIPDEFRRVGFEITLNERGTAFVVDRVYPGTDAASKGIIVGDVVTDIEEVHLDPVADQFTADTMLDGTPGQRKNITFGASTGNPALANYPGYVLVEDLIPNPQ
jgi:hypothetical protein